MLVGGLEGENGLGGSLELELGGVEVLLQEDVELVLLLGCLVVVLGDILLELFHQGLLLLVHDLQPSFQLEDLLTGP